MCPEQKVTKTKMFYSKKANHIKKRKSHTESDFGAQRQSSPPDASSSKMGTTMSNSPSNTKQHTQTPNKANISDFTGQAKTAQAPQYAAKPQQSPQQQQPQQPQPPPQPQQQPAATAQKVKTPLERCEDIQNELEKLEKDVNEFSGRKTDRAYLLIEELLTRCLLKLDEVPKGEDTFNQFRKSLINYTHRLSDRLESKCDDSKRATTNDCETSPSEAKRSKTPEVTVSQVGSDAKTIERADTTTPQATTTTTPISSESNQQKQDSNTEASTAPTQTTDSPPQSAETNKLA